MIVTAEPELARYLSWVSKPTRAKRWLVKHEMWELEDGEWVTRRYVPSLHELERDGRRPIIIGQDAVEAASSLERAKPTQGDIDDAFKGLEPTLAIDPDGNERTDYKRIPLKNADGSLTKYAKRLIDMHQPTIEKGLELSSKIQTARAKVES